MIEVTKLNGTKFLINSDYIQIVEETPDTVLTLVDGRKYIIKESLLEIKNLVTAAKQAYYGIAANNGTEKIAE